MRSEIEINVWREKFSRGHTTESTFGQSDIYVRKKLPRQWTQFKLMYKPNEQSVESCFLSVGHATEMTLGQFEHLCQKDSLT